LAKKSNLAEKRRDGDGPLLLHPNGSPFGWSFASVKGEFSSPLFPVTSLEGKLNVMM